MGRVSLQTLISRSKKSMGKVHPAVKSKAVSIIKQAYDEGINVQVSSGFRSFKRQNELYAQGRTTSGNIVTNARAGQSVHNYGLAIDYFLTTWDGSRATWTVNKDWKRVAAIGKAHGFSWGGDWSSFKDYPHLELTDGLSWRDLKAGKRPHRLLKDENDGILEHGESGTDIEGLQQQLKRAGYKLEKHGADGHFGDETEGAVKDFQRKHNLEVDGVVGPKTKAKLKDVNEGNKFSSASDPNRLRNGDKGDPVEKYQQLLERAEYDLGKYGADGYFGDSTEKATKAFQKAHGLEVDGIAGPKTQAKLKEVLNQKEESDMAFKDVDENKWYAGELEEAEKAGIARGLPDDTFNPEDPVTRAEAAVFALRAYKNANK